MVPRYESWKRVREKLFRDENVERMRQELLDAACAYWSAEYESPLWPPELRIRSHELQIKLFAHGTIRQTIGRMTAPELTRLRDQLSDFFGLAERAGGLDALGDLAPESEAAPGTGGHHSAFPAGSGHDKPRGGGVESMMNP